MKTKTLLPLLLALATLTTNLSATVLGTTGSTPVAMTYPGAANTGTTSPGVAPVITNPSGPFTGTWSQPGSPWNLSFSATGQYPSSGFSGTTQWDFTTLFPGYLAAGTLFRLGDVDSGSGSGETISLIAYDSALMPILLDWLDQPSFVAGPNLTDQSAAAMPLYTKMGSTYTFDGTGIGNFLTTVSLASNQNIFYLDVIKSQTNNGFGLASSPAPEPGTWVLMGAGLMAVGVLGRRQKRQS